MYWTRNKKEELQMLIDAGKTPAEIISILGISRNSYRAARFKYYQPPITDYENPLKGDLIRRNDAAIVLLREHHPERELLKYRPKPKKIKLVPRIPAPPVQVAPPPAPIKFKNSPSVFDIIQIVCDFYRVTRRSFFSNSRAHEFVIPRWIAAKLAFEFTKKSYSEIGRLFERDHTTILHAIRSIDKKISCNERIADEVGILRMKIRERWNLQDDVVPFKATTVAA